MSLPKPLFGSIPIDKIEYRPREYNIRSREDITKDLDEMVENVKMYGVLQPIIVNKIGDKYIPIAGQRRVEAAKKAGLKEVPALIYENLPQTDCIKMSLSETLFRKDVGEADMMEAVTFLYHQYNRNYKAVAQLIGKSESWVRKYVKMEEKLPEDIKRDEELKTDIKSTIADIVTKIADVVGDEKAHEVARQYAQKVKAEDMKVTEAKELAKQVIKAAREGPRRDAKEIVEAGIRGFLKERERIESEKKAMEQFGPHVIIVRLDERTDEALTKAAQVKGRDKSDVAAEYVIDGLHREGYLG
jgi:ParB family chromosome partitioning protein